MSLIALDAIEPALDYMICKDALQKEHAIGPVRVIETKRAKRRVSWRLIYSHGSQLTGIRTAGLPPTLFRSPSVSLRHWPLSKKSLYSYNPMHIASMRATGKIGPLMTDVFWAMRDREKVLGRASLPTAVQSRHTRLVNMIKDVCREDKLNSSTELKMYCAHKNVIHLAVEYMNRFLAAPPSPQTHDDQAIALACWFMATKIESRLSHPLCIDLVAVSGRGTSAKSLLAAEMHVCIAIDYQLSVVTPQLFLEWFVLAFSIEPSVANVARGFVCRALHQFDGTACYPSEVAIAALEVAAGRRAGPSYGKELSECLCKYADVDVSAVGAAAVLCFECVTAPNGHVET